MRTQGWLLQLVFTVWAMTPDSLRAMEPSLLPPQAFAHQSSLRSLAEIKLGIEEIRYAVWTLPQVTGYTTPDEQGHSFVRDLGDMVLRDDVNRAMTVQMASLEKSLGDLSTDERVEALKPLAHMVLNEMARVTLLIQYWGASEHRLVHMAYINPLLARASEPQRAEARATLAAAGARISEIRTLAGTADPSSTLDPQRQKALTLAVFEVSDVYNDVRGKLAKLLPPDGADNSLVREEACPPAVAPTSDHSRLQYKSGPDMSDFYPPAMVHEEITGMTYVRMDVSSTGCITQARVVTSSGVPEFDRAALRFVLQSQMYPASVDGKALDASAVLPVRFYLRERTDPAP